MIIIHFQDLDLRYCCAFDAAVVQTRDWVIVDLEDEPYRAPQIECELFVSVFSQLMKAAGRTIHRRKGWCASEREEPSLDHLPLLGPPTPSAGPIVGTRLLEFSVSP